MQTSVFFLSRSLSAESGSHPLSWIVDNVTGRYKALWEAKWCLILTTIINSCCFSIYFNTTIGLLGGINCVMLKINRRAPNFCVLVVVLLSLSLCPSLDAAYWNRHTINDSVFAGADGVRARDINEDGLPDVAVAFVESGIIQIYHHPGYPSVKNPWPGETIVHPFIAVEDAFFEDVDADGQFDIVSTRKSSNDGVEVSFAESGGGWLTDSFKSTAPPFVPQNKWIISTSMDVNQDGHMDIIAGGLPDLSSPQPKIVWLEAPAINKRHLDTWKTHVIGDTIWTMTLDNLDVDGDSDSDLIVSDRWQLRWLENDGSTGMWNSHVIGSGHTYMMADTADLDGDGDWDVIVPIKDSIYDSVDRLLWYERTAGLSWIEHEIDWPDDFGSAKAVKAGDINGDGQMDLVVSAFNARNKSGIVWLEHANSVFDFEWVRHEVSGSGGVKFDLLTLLDLDGNGSLDILTTEQGQPDTDPGFGVVWYQRTFDITDFQNFLIGFTGSCATWECGNFDGDNDVDITDFYSHFLPNFTSTVGGAYSSTPPIPEPNAVLLLGFGSVLLAYMYCRFS